MKRTAAAFVLVAGVAGVTGCISPSQNANPAVMKSNDAEGRMATRAKATSGVTQAQGLRPVGQAKQAEVIHAAAYGVDRMNNGGVTDPNLRQASGGAPGAGFRDKYPPEVYGPTQRALGGTFGRGGIVPVPQMGPPNAVALVPGAMSGPGGVGMGGMFNNGRTSVRFVAPAGMKIAFMDASHSFGDAGREAPVRYNFLQGNIYRVRLNGIPNRPGKNYYPTIEVYGANAETITFLSHSTVPIGFTDEDFEQVNTGNMVVKVIYLPSATFQDVAAAEEIVSTKLEPGANPVEEAMRRGTILAVIRLGNIDLEDPTTPAMDAPPGGMAPPRMNAPTGPGMPLPPNPALPPSTMPIIEPKKNGETISLPMPGRKAAPADLPTIKAPMAK